MLAEPVAGALDLDEDSMVERAIEQRPGDDGEIFLGSAPALSWSKLSADIL